MTAHTFVVQLGAAWGGLQLHGDLLAHRLGQITCAVAGGLGDLGYRNGMAKITLMDMEPWGRIGLGDAKWKWIRTA